MSIKTGYGKRVKVFCTDGREITGFYSIYTSAEDNEPEPASITLETTSGLVEILETEIKEVQVLS